MSTKHDKSLDVLIVGENPTVNIHGRVSLTTLQAPRLPNHLILGRKRALTTMKRFVKKGRCIAIHGPPAMGKSILASKFCWENTKRFRDGVIWTRLGPSATVDTTFQEMARVAGCLGIHASSIKKASGIKEMSALLGQAIGDRRILFVVDDVWNSKLASFFKFGGPQSCVLITTRSVEVAENFAGTSAIAVDRLNQSDACLLLRDQLDDLSGLDKKIDRLAVITGGCPLSIIIACSNFRRAYRASAAEAAQLINAYLRDTALRMNMSIDVAPALQPTYVTEGSPVSLTVAIEQSWSSLSDQRRLILKSTTLFPTDPNSFPLAALLKASDANITDLRHLNDASLVVFEEQGRVKVHQTVSDFLGEREALSPDHANRCLGYWYAFCKAHMERTQLALEAIDAEAKNVEHLLRKVEPTADPEHFVLCVSALATLFEIRGDYRHAKGLLGRTVRWLALKPLQVRSAELYGRLGSVSEKAGNYKLAEALYKSALNIRPQNGEEKAYVLQNYGVLESKIGRAKRSLRLLRQALRIARRCGDHARIAAILKNIGAQTVRTGEFGICRPALAEALRLSRSLRDPSRRAGILTNLGFLRICEGRFGLASRDLKRALKIESDYQHKDKMCMVLTHLALIELKRGHTESATKRLKRVNRLAGRSHMQRRSLAEGYLALCYSMDGKLAAAGKCAENALRHSMQLGNRENIVNALIASGVVSMQRGDYRRASKLLSKAVAVARLGGYLRLNASAKYELGNLYLHRDLPVMAEQYFRQAKTLALKMPLRETIALSYFGLAQVDRRLHKPGLGRTSAKMALAILQKIGHTAARDVRHWLAKGALHGSR